MRTRLVVRGLVAVALTGALMGAGCWGWVGGPCEYTEIPGTATVVSVTPATENDDCTNAVEVVFDFAPTDTSLTEHVATGVTLTIGSGQNPPDSWVQDEGLTEGSQHPCNRWVITEGTCTPVIYRFTEVNYLDAIDACYE